MKKIVVLQITLFIVFAGSSVGMFAGTDIYNNIKSTIVDKTCFSCIKMDPVSEFVFTFKTVDNKPHPDFIIENLTEKGGGKVAISQVNILPSQWNNELMMAIGLMVIGFLVVFFMNLLAEKQD